MFSLDYFRSNKTGLLRSFVEKKYFNQDFSNKIVGTALQIRESMRDIMANIDDPAFSDDHRRILRLPN